MSYLSTTFQNLEEITWIFKNIDSSTCLESLVEVFPNVNTIFEFASNLKVSNPRDAEFSIRSEYEMEILLINCETEKAMTVKTKEVFLKSNLED